MSDANPFDPPVEATVADAYNPGQGPPGPEPIPKSLMFIGILGVIFGLLGLLGICSGGAVLVMSEMFVGLVPGGEDVKEAMRELMELQFIPSIVQLALSLIVSPLLVTACVGCLTRQLWSQGLTKIAMIGCIVSSLVGLALTAWMLLFHWETLMAPNRAQPGGEMATIVGQVFAIGLVIAQLVFYFWALIALRGKTITAFYEKLSSVDRSA